MTGSLALALQIPVLNPQSHYARSIFELSTWMLYISLAIFLLVAGLVTYAGWRFRARPARSPEGWIRATKPA